MKHSVRRLCQCLLLFLLPLLLSCGSEKKRYVVGVSQCSEDVWREKLNEELRIAALYYNDVDLRISSANDDVQMQTEQINKFVDEGVDLLIVAPGQVSISPAIDRAYEKGIPVIIFDRRTRSDKYTAYIGADNKEIGSSMGEYLAGTLTDGGRILELSGLSTSSPAIERNNGFDSVVQCRPGISIVEHLSADWTEQGAFCTVDSLLSKPHNEFDCVFAHNDRMAMGARRAAEKHGLNLEHIKFCGIDAMPQKGGGMELVDNGTLFASYTYTTRGDEVMLLAMNILEGKKYNRENQLSSALVTRDNARVLLMQNDETMGQQDHLSTLRSRVDKAASDFNTQRIYLLVLLVFVVLLIAVCAAAIYAFITRTRINQQLKASMDEQNRMTTEMEEMTQTQLQFFTNVSHELRTPLTLIAGPTEQLLEDPAVHGVQRIMLRSVFAGDKRETEEEEKLNETDKTFVGRLRTAIQENLGDSDFSVERLGEEIGLSRVQLYRKVKALTGQTPVELLRKARLTKARQLLEKTEKSVSEIAYEVGFTSPSYFNKCFKDEFDINPSSLR